MHISPKDSPGAVRVTFLSPTLPHGDCHSGSGLSNDIKIIKTRVRRIHTYGSFYIC